MIEGDSCMETHKARNGMRLLLTCLPILVAALALLTLPARAAVPAPDLLWQAPEGGKTGSEAGHLDSPIGLATDPNTGHVFVLDRGNTRVDEFTAWGEFVKAWGWGVATGDSQPQTCGPQAAPPTTTCLPGIKGTSAGQFGGLRGGIAVDEAGDVYVADMENTRVQKFDAEGNFLLMFGGEVNKTTGADVCTALSGDTCGKGVAGEGDGHFELEGGQSGNGRYLATGVGGAVFVGDRGRIQEFDADGSFESKVILGGELTGKTVTNLEVDTAGNFYVVAEGVPKIRKLSPTGTELMTFGVNPHPAALALDDSGNLYTTFEFREVIAFSPSGAALIPTGAGFGEPPKEKMGIFALASNTVTDSGAADIYLAVGSTQSEFDTSYVSAYGPPPLKWPPPQRPPDITAQYAVSVDSDGAALRAEINPRYWADTSYYLEYGTGKCSEGGCQTAVPVPPGVPLGAGQAGFAATTKAIQLGGLAPQSTYHYRFVAQSEGSEGQPVRGVGGKIGADGAEGTFTTKGPSAPPNTACPNGAFRGGASARLPDCRAYEMVTPVEKNNTDIAPLINAPSDPAALNQSALAGGRLTYTTSQAFGDAQGAPYVSQYIADRGTSGWQSRAITSPQGLTKVSNIITRIEVEYRAFTADLCSGVLLNFSSALLAPGAMEGFANLYNRTTCGTVAYGAINNSQPPNLPQGNGLPPELLGISADGSCAAFQFGDQLTPDANPGTPGTATNLQLYENCGGQLRLVSVLPNGTASKKDSSVGTYQGYGIRTASVKNGVSADGSTIYWSPRVDGMENGGNLYVRINASQPQSNVNVTKCTEPALACTLTVSSRSSQFWGAASDGSAALYTIKDTGSPLYGNLYRYDLAARKSTLIAGDVLGLLGASEDLSRIYFVSEEALAPGATAGKANLYLHEVDGGGDFRYIGALSSADAQAHVNRSSAVNVEPVKHTSQVSPSGSAAAFMSAASLTGYDNIDANSGEADMEIFLYDASANGGAGRLNCVSCNPSGARPTGRQLDDEINHGLGTWAAARIPAAQSQLYAPRALAESGRRLFFESFEALVPGDSNGKVDVYEWEAPGSGDCSEAAPSYSPPNGGCLALISSGESPSDSRFVDASADGTDVFFSTASSLLPQDPGLVDIYDARVGGGYPAPPPQAAACEGEACQGPIQAPNDPTPASAAFEGPGNVRAKPSPRCTRGKARRKGRCVNRKGHKKSKHAKRASHDRRAGR
ncbi:MAG: hypothetical protein WA862_01560 [Solirubrobacterales bacterium]